MSLNQYWHKHINGKTMHAKALRLIKSFWLLFCFSVVMYLTCKDIKRFLDNDDTTVIEFKRFNASPQDKYPVITLCFHGKYGKYALIYKDDVLKNYGLTVDQYWRMITGNSNATADDVKNLPRFSSVTTSLEEIVESISTINRNDRGVYWWHKKKHSNQSSLTPYYLTPNSHWPFYLSYQNPDQVCYSQHAEYKPNFVKSSDYIRLDTMILNYRHGIGRLDIYLHYGGQTLRSFVKEVTSIKLAKDRTNKTVRIQVSGFSAIKRRLDANIRCNSNFDDEDISFRNYVTSNITCVPPYWEDLIGNPSSLKPCTSARQLKIGYEYSQYGNIGNVLDLLPPPCSEMTMISSIHSTNGRNLELKFQYRNDKYWEIRNTRDFGMTSLWSGVGGFVGIFLGFSLFQLVEILLNKAFMFMKYSKLNDFQMKVV